MRPPDHNIYIYIYIYTLRPNVIPNSAFGRDPYFSIFMIFMNIITLRPNDDFHYQVLRPNDDFH